MPTNSEQSKSVLVVDDERNNITLVERALRPHRHLQVVGAASGQAALDYLEAGNVDLFIVDFRMPGITGLELLQRARALGVTAPAVMVTGFGDHDEIQRALDDNLLSCVVNKPFAAFELVREVMSALGEDR